tara:strand:- start:194 stop:364 length:171 start_codon:yes stop_codon:yes gene_type:complete
MGGRILMVVKILVFFNDFENINKKKTTVEKCLYDQKVVDKITLAKARRERDGKYIK